MGKLQGNASRFQLPRNAPKSISSDCSGALMVVGIYGALSTWWMTAVEDRQCPQGGSWRRTGETVGPEVCVLRPVPSDLREETEAGQVKVVLVEERRLLMVSVHQEVLVSTFIHGMAIEGSEGSGLPAVSPNPCLRTHLCPCPLEDRMVSSLPCPHSTCKVHSLNEWTSE